MATTSKNPPAAALDEEQSLLGVAKVLLRGIATHSPQEDAGDHRQFCAKLQETSDYLYLSPSPEARIQQAESAILSLRDYNLRADKRRQLKDVERGAIIQLLLKTLEDLNIASPARMEQLKAVERKLESAKDTEGLRAAKSSLADCLAEVRKEAERHQSDSSGDTAKDRVTNLEVRSAGEAALAAACASDAQTCAVILLVDRLPMCNRRYGREVGDKVLRFFAEFAKHSFAPDASIYRWSGPALVVLVPGALDKVQPEVRGILQTRLQYECETGSRMILLSVDATWRVFPMMVDPRLLINKLDAFIV